MDLNPPEDDVELGDDDHDDIHDGRTPLDRTIDKIGMGSRSQHLTRRPFAEV